MKLATRPRIAIAATMLAAGALLTPATPAAAGSLCYVYDCDWATYYYSDASYTTIVGAHSDGVVCGPMEWGEQTSFSKGGAYRC